MKYVSYYRVSTQKQGESGLGLDAQEAAIKAHLREGDEIIGSFTEIETGKRSDRPRLAEALKLAKKAKATLIVGKLDRLARNVHFISGLMESGVEFVACDMPSANRLTVHILAAVAEHEASLISQRTKDALAALKAKGVKLGNPNPAASLAKSAQTRSRMAVQGRENVRPIIDAIRASGLSTLREIASALNARGIKTARGGEWHPTSVARVMA